MLVLNRIRYLSTPELLGYVPSQSTTTLLHKVEIFQKWSLGTVNTIVRKKKE